MMNFNSLGTQTNSILQKYPTIQEFPSLGGTPQHSLSTQKSIKTCEIVAEKVSCSQTPGSFEKTIEVGVTPNQQEDFSNSSMSSHGQKIQQTLILKAQKQKKSKKDTNTVLKSPYFESKFGPDFSVIPLCCRTYFFDQQRILPAEDKRIQYKSYKFPFNPASIETLKKTVCAFLNSIGGELYIGVKETTNKKYRYILGNILTQNDKQQMIKAFRKISQGIYPNCTQSLQVQFVPVRKTPFPHINLLQQAQCYYYDFSNKNLDLNKCYYLPARYVIRVRVLAGNKNIMYSYIETECQLNKNSTSDEFIAFRSQNEVLVKEISQEVLKRYRQKLLYEKEKFTQPHEGPCFKPQIGNPKNQYDQIEDMIDSKKIQAVLYENPKNRLQQSQVKPIESDKSKDNKSRQQSRSKQNSSRLNQKHIEGNHGQVTEDELLLIFKHPLSFIVLNLTQEKLRICIAKTPAKEYARIEKGANSLNGSQILMISIDGYHHMEQFLRIKASIEKHYSKDKAEFVGISKAIKTETSEIKKIMENLLHQSQGHKRVVRKRHIEYYSLYVAASYLLCMREFGFHLDVVPE